MDTHPSQQHKEARKAILARWDARIELSVTTMEKARRIVNEELTETTQASKPGAKRAFTFGDESSPDEQSSARRRPRAPPKQVELPRLSPATSSTSHGVGAPRAPPRRVRRPNPLHSSASPHTRISPHEGTSTYSTATPSIAPQLEDPFATPRPLVPAFTASSAPTPPSSFSSSAAQQAHHNKAAPTSAELSEQEGENSEVDNDGAFVAVSQAGRMGQVPTNNQLKKNRKPADLLYRVWLPSLSDGKSRWQKLDVLPPAIRKELEMDFETIIGKSKTATLYASFLLPANIQAHLRRCLLHALIAKSGKLFPKNHEACEWCVKKRHMCASIRAGVEGELPFVGFLPLSPGLRGGLGPNDIGYWRAS